MRSILLLAILLCSSAAGAADCEINQTDRDAVTFPPLVEFGEGEGASGYRTVEAVEGAAELHVVSSYEGSGRVTVRRRDRPIVLVLASYEASRWQVAVEDGAKLQRVVLVGHKPGQRATGVADDIPVEVVKGTSGGQPWQRVTPSGRTTYVAQDFLTAIAEIRCLTGLVETSYQRGSDLGDMFVVPPSWPAIGPVIEHAEIPRVDPPYDPAAQLLAYEQAIADAPMELRDNMQLLVDLMRDGKFPVFVPTSKTAEDPSPVAELQPMFFPGAGDTFVLREGVTKCEGRKALAIIGTEGPDTIECSWGDQWYALGGGGDVVSDSWGDDVMVSGAGDDIFDAGWGNDVTIVPADWGDDVIDKTCHGSTMSKSDAERLGWDFPFKSFIVFGDGIEPAKLAWKDRTTLYYAPTDDYLTLAEDCFTFVFPKAGELPERPKR
jgi:hypothetical protein